LRRLSVLLSGENLETRPYFFCFIGTVHR
jgi:hypothetical protein